MVELTPLFVVFAAVLGLLIGSFLNVVAWRVPRGESIVNPPSACPNCGHRLSWWENIPVLSFLALRAKCRSCKTPISWRYPLLEAGTSLLFVLVFLHFGPVPELPAYLYLAAIAVALTAIDIDHKRLPDSIVLPSYVVLLVLFGVAALVAGDPANLIRAAIGGAALFAFYFLVAFAYPAGMGFGDVKLSGVLGLALGWVGWGALVIGAFAAFLVGAAVGLVMIALKRGGRKTAIPFGPFMLLGAAIGVAWGEQLAGGYLALMGF